jgi:pyridoxamine 5'-phosphate oxidase
MTYSADPPAFLQNLLESEASPDPIEQFHRWYSDAQRTGMPLPEGMTLATIDREGTPAARVVLLKDLDERGFVFYTNYQSIKGDELKARPEAALVFWWPPLERQVRISGRVEKVTAEESDAYFATRPRDSQIGAWASPQSEVVASREQLESRFHEMEERFAGREVPRPEHWGGYRLVPQRIEFWQGRPSRLHDRLLYVVRQDGGWDRQRLAP